MKIVLGITGASGAIYAIKFLEIVSNINNIDIYLIISEWGKKNIEIETDYSVDEVEDLATVVFDNKNMAAEISSGSFKTDGMIVLPCSMKTIGAVANGLSNNLIARTADVMIKEDRKLILCPRETPLTAIHLENMLKLANLEVKLIPPMPAFYNHPEKIEDLIGHHVMKILDNFDIDFNDIVRWIGDDL